MAKRTNIGSDAEVINMYGWKFLKIYKFKYSQWLLDSMGRKGETNSRLISVTKTKLGSLSSIDVYMLPLGSLCIYEYHTDIDICLQTIV